MDVDATGLTDGDQLADPRMPPDRGRQPADHSVVLRLADQPRQLTTEASILGGDRGQDLGQRTNRRGVLRPGGDLLKDSRKVATSDGPLDQPGELGLARPDAGLGLPAVRVDLAGG
jgi:hypothetical protein